MADIKLFQIHSSGVTELTGQSMAVEKSLQKLIEANLDVLLGVRFLASEHTTGKNHGGRIDTLGIDENGFPVIIEYKRALNENVINQGLFYLNWLMDHKAEFELMTLKKFGQNTANQIDWSSPRLLCIAGDFTKYDEHAVQQINHNIELLRYRKYGEDLLLLDLVNAVSVPQNTSARSTPSIETVSPQATTSPISGGTNRTVSTNLESSSDTLKDLYYELDAFITALGDDVQKKTLKLYFAYKRIKNFVCVEVHPSVHRLLVFVKVDPDSIELEHGFTRDVRAIGHFGTGDLEIRISNRSHLEKAKPLIVKSYEES